MKHDHLREHGNCFRNMQNKLCEMIATTNCVTVTVLGKVLAFPVYALICRHFWGPHESVAMSEVLCS